MAFVCEHVLIESQGAGHPGEDDIGGLVLVSTVRLFHSSLSSLFVAGVARPCHQGTQGPIRGFWRYCRCPRSRRRFGVGRCCKFLFMLRTRGRILNCDLSQGANMGNCPS